MTEFAHTLSATRRDFPFPLFLYVVVFFFTGLFNIFQAERVYRWIFFDYSLWGLVNLYLLQYTYGWVGMFVSLSGILNVTSAVFVYKGRKYARELAYGNLAFGVFVGFLIFFNREQYFAPTISSTYMALAVFIAANAGWFWYFKRRSDLF